MQTQGAGNVTLEAGNAEAHVLGVAQSLQKQGGQAHHNACDDYEPVLFEKPFHVIMDPFSLYRMLTRPII